MTQFGEYPSPQRYTVDYLIKALVNGELGEVKASEYWTDELLDWSQKKDLERARKLYKNEGYDWIKEGSARGKITGGCLYSLLQLKGTEYEPDYNNKILFIETPEGQDYTKGEPLAFVWIQLNDLKNSGALKKIKGLIVGKGFGYSEDERSQFRSMVKEIIQDYNFPVLFNVNIGHADPIVTLPLGVEVSLDSSKNLFRIEEQGII
jgi:muramoyltetrapeptide carboxypeptidase